VERTHSLVGGASAAGVWAAVREEADGREDLVDASPDALAALTRRAREAGVADRVRALQGDADRLADLCEPGSAELILCHSVLEVVDDPAGVLAALFATLRPGGAASILVANRAAAVLARAMGGHFAAATALLEDADGRFGPADKLRRRFDVPGIAALVTAAGLAVEKIHGVRVAAVLVPALADAEPEAVRAFELAVSALPPYRDIATQLHVFTRRPI
jgi:S-adenosylmethionine-dependent methyltransferase